MRDKGTIGNEATSSFYYKCFSYLPQKVNWAVFTLFLFSGHISVRFLPPIDLVYLSVKTIQVCFIFNFLFFVCACIDLYY